MGAVNIFLGGTGKYIAADIESQKQFHELNISDPIAFDLDGSSPIPGIPVAGLVGADAGTDQAVVTRAGNWASLNPGGGVGPADGWAPGPTISAEHSVLVDIGKGVNASPKPDQGLYALRSHGLAVFSLLFDEAATLAGAGAGNKLKNLIKSGVTVSGGGEPRFNLVTSTAGGTGAGTVIPLALWLKREYPDCSLTLVAVVPSAFAGVLAGAAGLDELAAKGKSGTYALLREISFLHQPDPQVSSFSARRLPVISGGLEYRPGQKLFNRVYWFGRKGETGRDAFEEAALLVRILSVDNAAQALDGLTGADPLQPVGSMTSIEYPKLRLQQKLVYSVLSDLYAGLRRPKPVLTGGQAPSASVDLLDYLDAATDRPLGSWFFDERHGVFSAGAQSALDHRVAGALEQKTLAAASVGRHDSIARGAHRIQSGYDAVDGEWNSYVGGLTSDLNTASNINQSRIEEVVRAGRSAEEDAFSSWLDRTIFDQRLSGDADGLVSSTQDMIALLDRLEQRANDLDQLVAGQTLPGETPAQAGSAINTQINQVAKPEQRRAKPRFGQLIVGLALAGLAMLAVSAVSGAIPAFTLSSVPSRLLAWLGAIVTVFVVNRSALWAMLRRERAAATLPSTRLREEERLFALYRRQDSVRALHWTYAMLRGGDGTPSLFGALRQHVRTARDAVRQLDDVYKGLGDLATGVATRSGTRPSHVAQEVGGCLQEDPGLSDAIRPELVRRLRVVASLGGVQLHFVPSGATDDGKFEAASADLLSLAQALAAEEGAHAVDAKKQLEALQHAAWDIVNWHLGQQLPVDFRTALLRCADNDGAKATGDLATMLSIVAMDLPRSPSVDLPGLIGNSPFGRRLYVGNTAILAAFNQALNDPHVKASDRAILASYHQNYDIVPALGEQIVFLDLWSSAKGADWAPDVISASPTGDEAQRTYYGTVQGTPKAATARGTCFTLIPELLAATKVELGGVVAPLNLAVCARLLGSDPDTQGPTLAELFYLLRSREMVRTEAVGQGPAQRLETRISDGEHTSLALLSRPIGGLGGPDDVFGDGRTVVTDFDAFVAFMRFDGTPMLAGPRSVSTIQVPGAEVHEQEWAGAPQTVAMLQRAAVGVWYGADLHADCERMAACLQRDVALMAGSECGEDWLRAMEVSPKRRATWSQFLH